MIILVVDIFVSIWTLPIPISNIAVLYIYRSSVSARQKVQYFGTTFGFSTIKMGILVRFLGWN
jgi:hypothetical protein